MNEYLLDDECEGEFELHEMVRGEARCKWKNVLELPGKAGE